MELRLIQAPLMAQKQDLQSVIRLAELLSVPDEALAYVAQEVARNPDYVENAIQTELDKTSLIGPGGQVQAFYANRNPQGGQRRGGMILPPDIDSIEARLEGGNETLIVTPDVTYVGRTGEKPTLVLSDHLNGSMKLEMIQVDKEAHPLAARLLAQLRKFDLWKRDVMRRGYSAIGARQREFFEELDPTTLHYLTQDTLGSDLGVSGTTISRVFRNRWVEALAVDGTKKVLNIADLFPTRDDVKIYSAVRDINELLHGEYIELKALSDGEIADQIPGIARRTVAKYRNAARIPTAAQRQKLYNKMHVFEPYQIPQKI